LKTAGPLELHFNLEATIITTLFALYLLVVALSVYLFGTLVTVTTPLHPIAGSLGIFAEAFIGFKASSMFGGRRNFMGRLLTYYSIALVAQAISWVIWGLFAGGRIPTGSTLIILGLGSIIGQVLSAFSMFLSARAVTVKLGRRLVVMIVAAIIFSAGLSGTLAIYSHTLENLIVWSGIWSLSICVQLACGLVLVSLLGKWYMARPIAYIAFAYIGYSVLTSVVTMAQIIGRLSAANYWVIISVISAVSFYIVGLAMSQAKPMKRNAAPAETNLRPS
jgi:hypothetical protein